ncbi:MAG: PAS domain S-box protein [Deltaproteobacteria bacterium]|nr:PAS domain S-box protein [Deltaproteobacteria bacterium]
MKSLKIFKGKQIKKTIAFTLLVRMALATAVITLISMGLITRYAESVLTDSIKTKASFISYSLEKAISPLIEKGNIDSVQRLIENAASFPFIKKLQLIDTHFSIVASNNLFEVNELLQNEALQDIFQSNTNRSENIGDHQFLVSTPIKGDRYIVENNNDINWILLITLDLNYEDQFFVTFKNVITLQSVILFSVLTILSLIIVYRAVIIPFRKFIIAADKVSVGDYHFQVEHRTENELGRFAQAFNIMVEELNKREKTINAAFSDLRDRSARITAILKTTADGIVTANTAGQIESFNPAAETIFGYREAAIINHDIKILFPPALQADFNAYLTNENKIFKKSREMSGQHKNGMVFPMEISINETELENRQFYTLTVRDITERKQFEEKHQKAYKAGMAENAVAVLHNIGNAITPVKVNLNFLSQKDGLIVIARYLEKFRQLLEEHQKDNDLEYFFNQDEKGKQMIPFLNQLSDQLKEQAAEDQKLIQNMEIHINHISEIISLQQKYADFKSESDHFQLENVLLDAIKMVRNSMEKRGILLEIELAENLPPLKSDKNKLVQVLLNLLKNAIESIDLDLQKNPGKKPVIRLTASLTDNRYVQLIIDDNGNGIDSDHLKDVCNFGFTTKNRNSGFGLHDSANFVLANQGIFNITSPGIGKGARVILALPADLEANGTNDVSNKSQWMVNET